MLEFLKGVAGSADASYDYSGAAVVGGYGSDWMTSAVEMRSKLQSYWQTG
jgi:hypothetical protein